MISVGDEVVVLNDSLSCGLWKLGLVEELFKGKDVDIKGALVRLALKDGSRICSVSYPVPLSTRSYQ